MSLYSKVVIELADCDRTSKFRTFVDFCSSVGVSYAGTFSRFCGLDVDTGNPLEEEHDGNVPVEAICSQIDSRSGTNISVWEGKSSSFEIGLFNFENKDYLILHISDNELDDLAYDLESHKEKTLKLFLELFKSVDGIKAIFLTDRSFEESIRSLASTWQLKEVWFINFIMNREVLSHGSDIKFELNDKIEGVFVLANSFAGNDLAESNSGP